MKASKTKNRIETGFQQLKTGLPKGTVLKFLIFTDVKMAVWALSETLV